MSETPENHTLQLPIHEGETHPRSAPPNDDLALFQRFRAGDTDALGLIARRYEPLLLGLALGLLDARRDLALDAVQNTWVKVIRSAHTFDQRSSLKTWLYQITLNAARDLRTSALARPRREWALLRLRQPQHEQEPPLARSGQSLEPLRDAVANLAEAHREIVLLCYHAGLTHREVAGLLGIPQGTVKSRLHAALNALRAALPPELIHDR